MSSVITFDKKYRKNFKISSIMFLSSRIRIDNHLEITYFRFKIFRRKDPKNMKKKIEKV